MEESSTFRALFGRLRAAASDPRAYLRARRALAYLRPDFEPIENYVVFIGYPRSGHSLVGALLTAHPDAVISHELDALKYIDRGFGRDELFALIVERDRRFGRAGRDWTGYNYAIDRTWQGCYRRIRVIGDKKGGKSTTRLGRHPELLETISRRVELPVRFVHVVRNPFDNIATIRRKSERTLEQAVDAYFERCRTNADLRERISDDQLLEFRHEDLVGSSRRVVTSLVEFVGLEVFDYYLDQCSDFIFDEPNRSRFDIEWPGETQREVRRRMDRFEFLDGYDFDEGAT